MSVRVMLRGSLLFASLVLLVMLLKATGLSQALDEAWIDAYVRGHGVNGILIFLGAGGVFTAVGFPRQFIGFLGGYAFGFAEGTGLAVAAAALGCMTAFYYARFFGRSLVTNRFPGKIRKIDSFLADNPFAMTLLIRFLPVGSNAMTNLAAGVSSVAALPFISGSALGYIPQTAIFALVGTGIQLDATIHIGAAVVLFLLSGSLGLFLYRKYRHGRSLDGLNGDGLNGDSLNGDGLNGDDRDGHTADKNQSEEKVPEQHQSGDR